MYAVIYVMSICRTLLGRIGRLLYVECLLISRASHAADTNARNQAPVLRHVYHRPQHPITVYNNYNELVWTRAWPHRLTAPPPNCLCVIKTNCWDICGSFETVNLHIYVQNTILVTCSATCAHTSRDDVSENMWFSFKFYSHYRAFSVAGPIV